MLSLQEVQGEETLGLPGIPSLQIRGKAPKVPGPEMAPEFRAPPLVGELATPGVALAPEPI